MPDRVTMINKLYRSLSKKCTDMVNINISRIWYMYCMLYSVLDAQIQRSKKYHTETTLTINSHKIRYIGHPTFGQDTYFIQRTRSGGLLSTCMYNKGIKNKPTFGSRQMHQLTKSNEV